MVVFLTVGCGGGKDASSAPVASGTKGSSAVPAPDSGTAPTDGKATCDFLRGVLPKLQAVGSSVGALAQLAGAYSGFVEQNTPSQRPDSLVLDELTTRECPAVRTAVLKVRGVNSFAGNL